MEKSLKMPYDAQMLLSLVRNHFVGKPRCFRGKRVAFTYEAGPTGFGVYDEITPGGYCSSEVIRGLGECDAAGVREGSTTERR